LFWLIILGCVLFVYSAIMCFLRIEKEHLQKIRRIFYSLWIILCAAVLLFASSTAIKQYGQNILGLAPEVWVLIILFVGGLLVDTFIVSAMPFKSITLGNLKIEGEDAYSVIKGARDTSRALQDKVVAQYRVLDDLKNQGIETTQDFDLMEGFHNILDKYLRLQQDQNQGIDVIELTDDELDTAVRRYKLSSREQAQLKRNASEGVVSQFKHDEWYMFTPYECVSKDVTILIVLMSKEETIQAESYLLLGLLEQFEDYLIDID